MRAEVVLRLAGGAQSKASMAQLSSPLVIFLREQPKATLRQIPVPWLEWREAVWDPMIAELRDAGFLWDTWLAAHTPVPGDHGELARVQRAGSHGLADIVEAKAALLLKEELSAALENQRSYLAGFPQSDAASILLASQDIWDVGNYEEACRELARLEGLRDAYETRFLRFSPGSNQPLPRGCTSLPDASNRTIPRNLPVIPLVLGNGDNGIKS